MESPPISAHKPLITVLGVKYLHLRVQDGTDLYVTGVWASPSPQCLLPENTGPM